jgi:phage terminase large subunit-like protein
MTKAVKDVDAVLARLEAERDRRVAENRLAHYKPYAKQAEFHAAGKKFRERLLMAGNQLGKTIAGGFEAAMHATGRYPDEWQGYTINRANVAWIGSPTALTLRDNPQRILLGREGAHGTGAIPKDAIKELVPARSVAGLIDTIVVRHGGGGDTQAGQSLIGLKSYEQGREKWQGETLDWLWVDEEPPEDIYTEGLTRTNVAQGPVYLTFTPLKGVSAVVKRFLVDKSPDRHVTSMTIDDAEHYTPEQREKIAASYPAHEREARVKGVPVLGSGRIFPVAEESLYFEPRDFPDHWPRIGGMDFGWTHPFAAVEVVWDRDGDTVYVNRTHRMAEATPIVHAAAIRPWGNLRWSWPRDGRRDTLEGAGKALADQFKAQQLDMLPIHAQFDDGSVSVEAGLFIMLQMMETGRFKVMRHLNDWFEEFRLYHRKDGKVVKEGDDLMAATRYAIMMLRYATAVKDPYKLRVGSYATRQFMRNLGRGNLQWMGG